MYVFNICTYYLCNVCIMYVRMYASMYDVRMYVCMYVCTYVCMVYVCNISVFLPAVTFL